MNYILYCAFTDSKIIDMTIYSLKSLFYISKPFYKDTKAVIFTNNIEPFAREFQNNEFIVLEDIPEDTLQNWLGGLNYMPRIKIKSLQYFFSKYSGNVIFIDSDTFYLKTLEHLFEMVDEGRFIMYSACPSLSKLLKCLKEFFNEQPPNFPFPLYKFCLDMERNKSISNGQKRFEIPLSFNQFNSGVIGMNQSYSDIFDEVLELSDTIIKKYGYWCAEEFAFSYIFQGIQGITRCDDTVYHYFNDKWVRYILEVFLEGVNKDVKNELYSYLKENNLDRLKSINLVYEDLPYFIYFVRVYILKYGTDKLHQMYFDEDSFYIGITKNICIYEKFMSLWEKNK
ncbi:hypothetical protein [Ruminiclostridium cellobioparum]|uniref:hypothetical protein n=1 Tax=Ruminiclostridium cellobioparum TaxID=29355 RepID=UPI00048676B5|nr:hypothetical protein [Ruminiclostridium cellobioparum]